MMMMTKFNCCSWPLSYSHTHKFKTILQPHTTLNFHLLTNGHPHTYNYTTENSKLTFTASNHTEFQGTAKMEKAKYSSVGDMFLCDKYIITDDCNTVW
jgi:hypothetical protein